MRRVPLQQTIRYLACSAVAGVAFHFWLLSEVPAAIPMIWWRRLGVVGAGVLGATAAVLTRTGSLAGVAVVAGILADLIWFVPFMCYGPRISHLDLLFTDDLGTWMPPALAAVAGAHLTELTLLGRPTGPREALLRLRSGVKRAQGSRRGRHSDEQRHEDGWH